MSLFMYSMSRDKSGRAAIIEVSEDVTAFSVYFSAVIKELFCDTPFLAMIVLGRPGKDSPPTGRLSAAGCGANICI